MRALTLSLRQGWSWLPAGFAIFRRNPPLLALLVLAYWLIVGFINLIPGAGMVAATLCIPAFSVGLMQAARDVDQTGKTRFDTLFAGFRQNFPALLQLGGLYLGATLLVLSISSIADGGQLMRFMLAGQAPPPPVDGEAGFNAPFFAATQIALVLLVPVVMAWWYAPILAAWHGQPAVKALFFSFVVCVQNWRAFIGYATAMLFYAAILPGIALAVLMIILPGNGAFLQTLLTVPLLFILAPTLIASFYVSYRDVFVIDERV